jgi:hypothetical protein
MLCVIGRQGCTRLQVCHGKIKTAGRYARGGGLSGAGEVYPVVPEMDDESPAPYLEASGIFMAAVFHERHLHGRLTRL